MHTKPIGVLLAFTAALSSAPAMAQVCGIGRVERMGPTSVRLYLESARPGALLRQVEFVHAGAKRVMAIEPPSTWKGPEAEHPGIPAQLGDEVISYAPRCLMTVTTKKGRIGVEVRRPGGPAIGRHAPWFPPPDEVFIPAQ